MCYFNRIDTIDRDPSAAQEAILAFNRLLRAYPQSPYNDEAREQVKSAREFLAKHEMYVADFYINIELYPQAIGRLQYIMDNYSDSEVAPKASQLLTMLQAGTPPKGKWSDWIPQISMPDWAIFRQMGFGFGAKTE
jgi:outer membrane protein assembly factor BamD